MRKTRGQAHSSVADALHSLGRLLGNNGRYDEACEALESAAHIKEAALGPDALSLAKTLAGLATVFAEMGRNAEAAELLSRCMAIQTMNAGYTSGDNARTLFTMARLTNSLEQLRESLRISLQVWPPTHSHTVKVRRELAARHLRDGNAGQALAEAQVAMRICVARVAVPV